MSYLIKRLRELAHAVTLPRDEMLSEFTMRIPAEPKRDADLILSQAAMMLVLDAKEIHSLTGQLERQAENGLAAMSVVADQHVEDAEALRTLSDENKDLRSLVQCTECSEELGTSDYHGWMAGMCSGCQAEAYEKSVEGTPI